MVARRAKQLINGAKPMVEIEAQNPLTIAIEEVNQGLVTLEMLDNVNIYLTEETKIQEEGENSEEVDGELEVTEEQSEIETAPEKISEPEVEETSEPDDTESKK